MKNAFISILFIFTIGCASSPYISGSIQVHSINKDKPEIGLDNPVGEFEIGTEYKNSSIFLRHMSGITQDERGYGYNSVGVRHKLYLENLWE